MSECRRWIEEGLEHFSCNPLMFPENQILEVQSELPLIYVVLTIVVYILFIVAVIGYLLNIFKLIKRGDFDTRLSIRIVGIFVPPIGSIVGWC